MKNRLSQAASSLFSSAKSFISQISCPNTCESVLRPCLICSPNHIKNPLLPLNATICYSPERVSFPWIPKRTLSINPFIDPSFVDFRKSKPTLSLCSSLSTISGVYFNVCAVYNLQGLTISEYEDNILKMKEQFPKIDRKSKFYMSEYSYMRRTWSKEIDKLGYHQLFFFVESSYMDMAPIKLLINGETGKLAGVMGKAKLVLFFKFEELYKETELNKSEQLKKNDNLKKDFARWAGVASSDVYLKDVNILYDGYLRFGELGIKTSIEGVNEFLDFCENGIPGSKLPYYEQCISFLFSLMFKGVLFPGVFDFVKTALRNDYSGDGKIPKVIHPFIRAWQDVSNWWFRSCSNYEPLKLGGKLFDMKEVAREVSVLNSNFISDEAQKDKLKRQSFNDTSMDKLQKERQANYFRKTNEYEPAKMRAAQDAWEACKRGDDEDRYFKNLKSTDPDPDVVEGAVEGWLEAMLVYWD